MGKINGVLAVWGQVIREAHSHSVRAEQYGSYRYAK